jgi:hypothetical protein
MKKGGGGFGFVLAIVVLLIVMLLSAKAWNAVMPTAAQALAPPGTRQGAIRQVDDHGQTEVGKEIRSGTLPDLNKMLQSTDQHIKQVQEDSKKQD